MTRPKRLAADSASIAVAAMLEAATALPACPKHMRLRRQDRPFWEGILRARARDEWTQADIVLGVQLARAQADVEAQQKLLDGEGSVITNKRGTLVTNPRAGVLDQLCRRQLALQRALRIGGGPVAIRDLNARRGVQRAAERARAEILDDDVNSLLA